MARDLNGSSQYLSFASPIHSSYPFAMACRFNTDSATAEQTLMYIGASGGSTQWSLRARGNIAGDPVAALNINTAGSAGIASTSTGFSTGTNHHAAGVFISSVLRWAFIDGGSQGTNTTNITVGTVNATRIGIDIAVASPQRFFNGRISEAGWWDLSVYSGATDTDKAQSWVDKVLVGLSVQNLSPLHYPLGLLTYYRGLDNDGDIDWWGNNNFSAVATPGWGDHPTVQLPSKMQMWVPAPASYPPIFSGRPRRVWRSHH